MNEYSAVYDDAIDSTLELLETNKQFAYIIDVRTKMARIDVPDWNGNDFNKAVAKLVTYLMPHLEPSLPFDATELSQDEYYGFWKGLAEHLLMTVD
ncbi:MAG: hypothetical protein AB2784_08010 [Candidatus Thiodiazotropha endolucinida]